MHSDIKLHKRDIFDDIYEINFNNISNNTYVIFISEMEYKLEPYNSFNRIIEEGTSIRYYLEEYAYSKHIKYHDNIDFEVGNITLKRKLTMVNRYRMDYRS